MIHALENLTFKSEASAFLLACVNHFLKSEEVAFDTLVSYQIDSPKTTLAKQVLDDITISYYGSNGKSRLYILHAAPRKIMVFMMFLSGYPLPSGVGGKKGRRSGSWLLTPQGAIFSRNGENC